jgi:hypothetical protein
MSPTEETGMSISKRLGALISIPLAAAAAVVALSAASPAQAAANPSGAIHLSDTSKWWGVADTNIGCPNVNEQYVSLENSKTLKYDCWKWTAIPQGKVTGTGPFSVRRFDTQLRGHKLFYFTNVGSNPTEYLAQAFGFVGTVNKFTGGRLWVQDGGYLVSVQYSDTKNKLEVMSGVLRPGAAVGLEPIGFHGVRQHWSIP